MCKLCIYAVKMSDINKWTLMIDYLLTRAFAVVHVKVPVVACLQSYPLQRLLAPAAPAQPVAHPACTWGCTAVMYCSNTTATRQYHTNTTELSSLAKSVKGQQQIKDFYRAVCSVLRYSFMNATYNIATAIPSVRLSMTLRYCIKTAEGIIKLFFFTAS